MRAYEVPCDIKAVGQMSRAKRLRVYRQLERIRTQYERSVRSNFRTVFSAERDAILELDDPTERDILGAVKSTDKTKSRVLENMGMRIAEAVYPMVDESMTAKAWAEHLTSKAVGVEGDIDEDDEWAVEMRRWIAENTALKVVQIDTTTMEEIRRLLNEATSVVDFRMKVDSLYLDQIIPNRSSVIARTETAAATNSTAIQTVRSLDSARTEYKTWNTCLDATVRDTHQHQEGHTIERDEVFQWTGPAGLTRMDYPVDWQYGAPARECVNCRCFLTFSAE